MANNDYPILVTGAAGFIGYSLIKELLKRRENVIGIDNLNDYYDLNLKKSRIEQLNFFAKEKNIFWKFFKTSIDNFKELENIFDIIAKSNPEL